MKKEYSATRVKETIKLDSSKVQCDALLMEAFDYLGRGLHPIPIISKDGGKKPGSKWKDYQSRQPTETELQNMFARRGVNGIGVIHCNGVANRDFDTQAGYDQWKDKYPALARSTPTMRTCRGFGVWHRTDWPGFAKLSDGEYRADPGHLSLVPRSQHWSGVRYEWVVPLPKGDLPEVSHSVFLVDQYVAENAECHSLPSLLSLPSLQHPLSVDELINSTLPTVEGERNSSIMSLARGAKFNLNLSDFIELKKIVRQWHQKALPIIATKDFDTTWADFIHAFDRAKHPLGINLLDAAGLAVDPHDLPEISANYSNESTRRLIGLCASLASLNKSDGKFFASSHKIAPMISVTPMQTWRMLRMLERDGVIECLDRGNERRAARYRYIGGADRGEE